MLQQSVVLVVFDGFLTGCINHNSATSVNLFLPPLFTPVSSVSVALTITDICQNYLSAWGRHVSTHHWACLSVSKIIWKHISGSPWNPLVRELWSEEQLIRLRPDWDFHCWTNLDLSGSKREKDLIQSPAGMFYQKEGIHFFDSQWYQPAGEMFNGNEFFCSIKEEVNILLCIKCSITGYTWSIPLQKHKELKTVTISHLNIISYLKTISEQSSGVVSSHLYYSEQTDLWPPLAGELLNNLTAPLGQSGVEPCSACARVAERPDGRTGGGQC